MNTYKFLLFFVSSLQSTFVYSDLSVSDYHKLKNTKEIVLYINGVGNGMFWYSTGLKKSANDTSNQLFCVPQNFGLTPDNYMNIFKMELETYKKIYDSMGDVPIGLVLLNGLKNTFPCDSASQQNTNIK